MDAFTLGAVGLLVWAVSPYLYGMLVTKLVSKRKAIVTVTLVVSVIVSGVFLLIDAMYIHTDPQSALAFVVIPLYQWALLLLATLPIYLLNKNKKGKI